MSRLNLVLKNKKEKHDMNRGFVSHYQTGFGNALVLEIAFRPRAPFSVEVQRPSTT